MKRKEITKKEFLYLILLSLLLIIGNKTTIAQQITRNHVYGNEKLFFNDLIIFGEHKVLRTTDKMKESKRKMYLLDKSNQITDTMKCSAITDIIPISDSTFIIWDLNYHVEIKIKNDKFVSSKIFKIRSGFSNYHGLSVIIDNYMVGQKYIPEDDCSYFKAAKIEQTNFCVFLKKPYRYEVGLNHFKLFQKKSSDDKTGIYKIKTNDLLYVLAIEIPKNTKASKEQRDSVKQNKSIETFTLLSSKYTCKRRTIRYYGWDNFEVLDNQLYLYEKNSCAIYVFDMNNNLKMIDKYILPVKNRSIDGWKYFVDHAGKTHYAVKRVKRSISKDANTKASKKKKKIPFYYEYYIYEINWDTQKLSFLLKGTHKPINISEGFVYTIVNSGKSSDIIAYPTNGESNYNDGLWINLEKKNYKYEDY